ncbi:hypothetical protein H0H92_003082 [Tricholoma furcatifolium]|nr:hypothetical protein H0H92_003082 [Tricholoma furcatifolium]
MPEEGVSSETLQHHKMDQKVEGTFTDASGRARVHEYIEERIKEHESIIRYYKKRRNELSVTYRIPPEVLAYIFSHAVGRRTDLSRIKRISHISSHWRDVAISTPSLWSTINVEDYPAKWIFEMLHRSKNVPLSILNATCVSKETYSILLQILASDLHRIRHVMLGDPHQDLSYCMPDISLDERSTLFQSLCPHDISKLERLEMNAYSMIDFQESDDAQPALQLPEQVTMEAASLKHLLLSGYWMDWQLCPAFGRSLKTFSISCIPNHLRPSTAQLLSFLSHLPLLETLSISSFGTPDEASSSHGIEMVHMKFLRHLKVSSRIPSNIVSILKYLTFPKETIVTVKIAPKINSLDKQITMTLQEMTRMADNLTNGSILELGLSDGKIQCWKARSNRSANSSSPLEQPVIELDFWKVMRPISSTSLRNTVLKSLCLDNLVRLEVKYYRNDKWALLLGSLPRLQELKIHSDEQAMITALSRRLNAGQLESQPSTDSHLAFPALTKLTIDSWELACNLRIASRKKSVIQGLLDCINLRNAAHLCLERLELRRCTGATDSVLSALQELVVDVIVATDTAEYDDDSDDYEDDNYDSTYSMDD